MSIKSPKNCVNSDGQKRCSLSLTMLLAAGYARRYFTNMKINYLFKVAILISTLQILNVEASPPCGIGIKYEEEQFMPLEDYTISIDHSKKSALWVVFLSLPLKYKGKSFEYLFFIKKEDDKITLLLTLEKESQDSQKVFFMLGATTSEFENINLQAGYMSFKDCMGKPTANRGIRYNIPIRVINKMH